MQDHSDMHRQCHGRGEKGEHAQEALEGPNNKIAVLFKPNWCEKDCSPNQICLFSGTNKVVFQTK
jgi:hypothetical protein